MEQDRRYERIAELFARASELEPRAREAFLERECGDNTDLRAAVEAMLVHDRRSRVPLDDPIGAPTAEFLPERAGDLVGTRIGHYHLRSVIASGGMGTVYQATQDKPRRTVAVKVMRRGLGSHSALRRFEYEAQVLARLRHPGIAHIHEAGIYENGGSGAQRIPFFVMEYIPNARPLTDYVREKGLSTTERLNLFRQVCDAVHHGHQKGIIHRDLKPANILVDSQGEPKIIDFGVARSTDSDMAATTLQTDVGQLIGTLQYMSPEQCDADPHDLDTRSDVYALGVVLYEMLCEQLPYDVSGAPIHEAVSVVRGATPVRPSSFNRTLRGDIETITLKALEKDRQRRYQSALDLAQDIKRYVNNETILARPPSLGYQLRKFAQRHRATAVALLGVAFALVLGVIATSWQAVRATNAEQDAVRLANAEAMQREIATENERQARTVIAFIETILGSAHPHEVSRHDYTVRQFLDQVAAEIGDGLAEEPGIEASLRLLIGSAYRAMGDVDRADEHARAALEAARRADSDKLAARSRLELGFVQHDRHDYRAAALTIEGAVEQFKVAFGDQHAYSARALTALAEIRSHLDDPAGTEAAARQALAIARTHEDASLTALCLLNLADHLASHDSPDEAEAAFREAIDLHEQKVGRNRNFAVALRRFAALLITQGRLREAESAAQTALAVETTIYGPDSLQLYFPLHELAQAQSALGDHQAAEVTMRDALERARARGDWFWISRTCTGLGTVLNELGRHAEAEELLGEGLRLMEAHPEADHPERITTMNNLAHALERQGHLQRAESLYRQALSSGRHDDPSTIRATLNLASVLDAMGQIDEAERIYLDGLDRLRETRGNEASETINAVSHLAWFYHRKGRHADAERYYGELARSPALDDDDPFKLLYMYNLGIQHSIQGNLEDAAAMYRLSLDGRQAALGDEDPATRDSMRELARTSSQLRWHEEAVALYEQWLEIETRLRGPRDPVVLTGTFDLAEELCRLGEYSDAIARFEALLPRLRSTYGERTPDMAKALHHLAAALDADGTRQRAEALARQAVEIYCEHATVDPGEHLHAVAILVTILESSKQLSEAEDVLRDHLVLQERISAHVLSIAGTNAMLGRNLNKQAQFEEAESVLRSCVETREQFVPDLWLHPSARSMLGEAILGQGRYEEAEAILIEAFEALADTQATPADQERAALARIVTLYDRWERPQQAQAWRERLHE